MINKSFGSLIKGFKDMLVEERVRLECKTTVNEHTTKIDIITRVNLRFAVKSIYEGEIYDLCGYKDRIVKLKKEIIYEKDYKSECITVHATLVNREKVDRALQAME